MRQLKFRVWNKRTQTWVGGCGRQESNDLDGVNLFGETIICGAFMSDVRIEDLDSCVALQATGLQDKNGKDIFEGDIVKLVCGDGYGCLSQKDFEVKFGEYPCQYGEGYADENEYGFYAESVDGLQYKISIAGAKKIFEVVGNIFEGVYAKKG